jgi:hypothetical protein
MNDENLARIRFRLEQDEDGYPPYASEGVWAEPVPPGGYRLLNVPWFAFNVAEGDVFLVESDADGTLWATERIERSENCTIRVYPLDDRSLGSVLQEFVALGAEGEIAGGSDYVVALTIPPEARIAEIKKRLQQGEEQGEWGYDEGCIDDAWKSA